MKRWSAGGHRLGLLALVSVLGCDRPRALPLASATAKPGLANEVDASPWRTAEAVPIEPRCRSSGPPAGAHEPAIDAASAPDPAVNEVEIGDAVACDRGAVRYAVGAVQRSGRDRVARLFFPPVDTSDGGAGDGHPPKEALAPPASWRAVDLGPTLGDAPPPRLGCARDGTLFAAAYRLGAGGTHDGARDLVVYVVPPGGPASPRWTVPQALDDSLAFDLAASGPGIVVAWDEATAGAARPFERGSEPASLSGGTPRSAPHAVRGAVAANAPPVGPRGVIRALALSGSTPAPLVAKAHDVSPFESDAELPRLVPTSAGLVALWIARAPDSGAAEAGLPVAEATGEAREYAWLEAAALDPGGSPRAPVLRLTPSTGHVSSYDTIALGDGSVIVVARDNGEAVDGSGGSLLRVRLAPGADRVDPPLAFPTDGLGRGAPAFVPGSGGHPGWLSWVGADEQLRLIPLDAAGAPAAPASLELALSMGRPLIALTASGAFAPSDEQILVATPGRTDAPLQALSCSRPLSR